MKYLIDRWMEQIISMDFLGKKKKKRLQKENSDVSSYVTLEVKCLGFLILCTEIYDWAPFVDLTVWFRRL